MSPSPSTTAGSAVDRVRALPESVPSARLRSSRAIRTVLGSGRRAHGHAMVVHARLRDMSAAEPTRIAVVAGRKVGGAVERNRVKRRLRAAVGATSVPPGFDIVVVGRRGALSVSFPTLCEEFARLQRRIVTPTGRG